MPWEQAFWDETIDQIQNSLTTWLPGLLSAIILLIAGWLVARISQAVFGRLLRRLGLDGLAERTGIAHGLSTVGIQGSLSRLLARITYWLVLIFFILLALGALGLTDVVTTALNGFFEFLPRLVAAMAIFLVGAFISRVIGDTIIAVTTQSNMATGRILGQAVHYSILLLVAILALDEIGVQTTILTTIIIITIGALALGLALAFGLGNRRLAHSIMAGFHAREEFTPGQKLIIGDYSGLLVRIGATKTVLQTSKGPVSLPNELLLNEVVQLGLEEMTGSEIEQAGGSGEQADK